MNDFWERVKQHQLAREKFNKRISLGPIGQPNNLGEPPDSTIGPVSELVVSSSAPVGEPDPLARNPLVQGMAQLQNPIGLSPNSLIVQESAKEIAAGINPTGIIPPYTKSAFLKAIQPIVAVVSGFAEEAPGAAQAMKIAQRDPGFKEFTEPKSATQAFGKWIGRMIGWANVGKLGAEAVGATGLAKLAPFGSSWGKRFVARLPFAAGESLALTANDLAKEAVSEDPNTGELIQQIPINFVLGAGAEATISKFIKSHGAAQAPKVVSYQQFDLLDKMKMEWERAGAAEVIKLEAAGVKGIKPKPFNVGESIAKFKEAGETQVSQLRDKGLNATVKDLAEAEWIAQQYPEAVWSQEARGVLAEKWDALKGGARQLTKGLESTLARLEDSLYNSATPEQNIPLIKAIGRGLGNMGLTMRRNMTIQTAAYRMWLSKLAPEFTLPNGELDTDLLAEIPKAVKTGAAEHPNEAVNKFLQGYRQAVNGIAEDAQGLGMKVWNAISNQFVPFIDKDNYWPNLHNWKELAKVLSSEAAGQSGTAEWELKQAIGGIFNEATSEPMTLHNITDTLLNYLVAKQEQSKTKWLRTSYNIPGGSFNPFEVLPRYFDDMVQAIETFRMFDTTVPVSELGEKLGNLAQHINPMDLHGPSVTQMLEAGLHAKFEEGVTKVSLRDALRSALGTLGGDTGMYDNLVDAITGRAPIKGAKFERGMSLLRTLNTVKWLPLSGITQIDSMVNTITREGIGRSVRGLFETFRKGSPETMGMSGVEWAKATGSAVNDLAHILDSLYPSRETSRFLSQIGATWVDRGLRHWAANAGRLFWQDMVQKAANEGIESIPADDIRRLSGLRLNLEKAVEYFQNTKSFDPEDLLKAGYEGHVQSQLLSNIIDSPVFTQHPLGRLLMSQRNYQYQMARFLKKEVFDEIKQGNLKPLARYLASSALVGEVKLDLRDAVRLKSPAQRGQDPSAFDPDLGNLLRNAGVNVTPGSTGEWLANRVLGNVLNGVGLGLWLDAAQAGIALYQHDIGQGLESIIGVPARTLHWAADTAASAIPEVLTMLQDSVNPSITLTKAQKAPFAPKLADFITTAAAASGVPAVSPLAGYARMALPGVSALLAPTKNQVARLPGFLKTPAGQFVSELAKAKHDKAQFDTRMNKALDSGNLSRALQQQTVLNQWMMRRYIPSLIRSGSQAGVPGKEVYSTSQSLLVTPEDLVQRARARILSKLRVGRLQDRTLVQGSWRVIEQAPDEAEE